MGDKNGHNHHGEDTKNHNDHDHGRIHYHISHEDHTTSLQDSLDHIRRGLGGSSGSSSTVQLGDSRQVTGAGTKPYTYEVDIYVEIDYYLCKLNNEDCLTGIGPNTLNYGETYPKLYLVALLWNHNAANMRDDVLYLFSECFSYWS